MEIVDQAPVIGDAGGSFSPALGRSVTIDHAARLLGVSRRTIYNRIRSGRLLTIRTLGGSQRVTVDSLRLLGFRGRPLSTAGVAAIAAFERVNRG